MRSNRLIRLLLLLALPAALAACNDPSGGGDDLVPGEELVFLRPAPDAPALETYDTSFVAVAGEDHEIRIDYVNGAECLRFRLDDESLLERPNGTRFREGDTVTIRIRLVDAGYFNFEFQPAGLKFDPDEPAELRVDYGFAHPDYNGDGEVDDDDDDFEFGWWRQEMPGQDWERIGSARVHDLTEVRADLDGFTRYALAGGH
jgi:predicted small secreted protein